MSTGTKLLRSFCVRCAYATKIAPQFGPVTKAICDVNMNELLRYIAFAVSFVVLLPLLIYFVFLCAAPKKTKNEKIIVFILIILSVGLMLWTAYRQGYSNEIQTSIIGLIFLIGSFFKTFEIQISKLLRIGILIVSVGLYIAAGSNI